MNEQQATSGPGPKSQSTTLSIDSTSVVQTSSTSTSQDLTEHRLPAVHDILPPEIMSIVFRFYLPVYDMYRTETTFRKNPVDVLTLSVVCRAWKEIAWNTPHLWTFVVFDFQGYRDSKVSSVIEFEERLGQLTGWLSRSGDLPLSISIVDYEGKYKCSRSLMQSLFITLLNFAPRWIHINADFYGRGIRELAQLIQQAVNIRSFSLKIRDPKNCESKEQYFTLTNHRSLTSISLNKTLFRWLSTDWEIVEHLRLRLFYIDESLQTLSLTKNLVRLCVREVAHGHDNLGLPAESVHLPHLQYLDWYCNDIRVDLEAFTSKLEAPSLRVFRWMSGKQRFSPCVILKLVVNSAASLRLLIVGGEENPEDEDQLFDFWSKSPYLTLVYIPEDNIRGERSAAPYVTDDLVHLYDNPQAERWCFTRLFMPALRKEGDVI